MVHITGAPLFAVLLLLVASPGWAASSGSPEVYDLYAGGGGTPPAIPAVINGAAFITNSNPAQGAASGQLDSFRIGQASALHLGYSPTAVASGGVGLSVASDLTIVGGVYLGKYATAGQSGLPAAAAGEPIDLSVAGDLVVDGGRLEATAGTNLAGTTLTVLGGAAFGRGAVVGLSGSGDVGRAVFRARDIAVSGAVLYLGANAEAYTAYAVDPVAAGQIRRYAVIVGQGGFIGVNGGIPTATWNFAGLDVQAGGDGILVGRGGLIASGVSGGTLRGRSPGVSGTPFQRLTVEAGGGIDASLGVLWLSGFGAVDLAGSYLAGYGGPIGGGVNHLVAPSASVDILPGSSLGLTRDLQRALIAGAVFTPDNAAILRAGSISFAAGGVPVIHSGLGQFNLALGQDSVDNLAALYVTDVANPVSGDGGAADRATFHSNLSRLAWESRITRPLADLVYSVSVAAVPHIVPSGEAGQVNREVLDAIATGYRQPVGTRGLVDEGVLELYTGASQYGPNTVAYNTATEVLALAGDRLALLERDIAAPETLSAGGREEALASLGLGEQRNARVWAGVFGRREDADLDYGVEGYRYRPRGIALGADGVSGRFGYGAALAIAEGDYQDKAASLDTSEIASYSGSLYAAYRAESGFSASAFAAYSRLDNSISDVRGGMAHEADFATEAWALGGKIGYECAPADRLRIHPSVGLTRAVAATREHGEVLDQVQVIRVGETKRRSTLAPVDLGFGYALLRTDSCLLRLDANLGYAYDFAGDGLEGDLTYNGLPGSAPVPSAVEDLGRHRFNLGAGVLFSGNRLDLAARYDYFRRASQDAHQVRGSLGVKF